jgi:cell division protein FtsZ
MRQRKKLNVLPKIKVVGVGGAGGNAISRMAGKIKNVELIAINTDIQDLEKVAARRKIQIGKTLTKGLGTGMNPEIGLQAAEENSEEIGDALEGGELIFVTCGLGGGTGSGGSPVVAKIAKDLGALTLAVVTKPFLFEGRERMRIAEDAWEKLAKNVDAIITVPNDRIFNLISRTTSINDAFFQIDKVLHSGVEGISDLITRPGLINVDFADIKTILGSAGEALLGIGYATGEERAKKAAEIAVRSPLLDLMIDGAHGILFAVSARTMTMSEVQNAANTVTEAIDQRARVIFGAIFDPRLKKDEIKVTAIAVGFNGGNNLKERNNPNSHTLPLKINTMESRKENPEVESLFQEKLKPYEKFEEPAFLRKKKQR